MPLLKNVGSNKRTVKNRLKNGFGRAVHDADMLELVEWGMSDYKQLVGKLAALLR